MSNYIHGYFTPTGSSVVADIAEEIRRHSSIGFHIRELEDIPDFSGFPRSADLAYFILSDHNETLLAEHLMTVWDWSEAYTGGLPRKQTDRISLIVDAVKRLAELSHSAKIGLWLSEVDQLEGTVEVPLSSLYEMICSDFKTRGIPCLLYDVVP